MPIYLCQPGANSKEPWRHGVQVYERPFPMDRASPGSRRRQRQRRRRHDGTPSSSNDDDGLIGGARVNDDGGLGDGPSPRDCPEQIVVVTPPLPPPASTPTTSTDSSSSSSCKLLLRYLSEKSNVETDRILIFSSSSSKDSDGGGTTTLLRRTLEDYNDVVYFEGGSMREMEADGKIDRLLGNDARIFVVDDDAGEFLSFFCWNMNLSFSRQYSTFIFCDRGERRRHPRRAWQ